MRWECFTFHHGPVFPSLFTLAETAMWGCCIAIQIPQCPAIATRMHRLFKSCFQRLMRGRRVESPGIRYNGDGGDTNHDNHSGCDLALGSTWGPADLALQSWLG